MQFDDSSAAENRDQYQSDGHGYSEPGYVNAQFGGKGILRLQSGVPGIHGTSEGWQASILGSMRSPANMPNAHVYLQRHRE
jgi:hypothetical protein